MKRLLTLLPIPLRLLPTLLPIPLRLLPTPLKRLLTLPLATDFIQACIFKAPRECGALCCAAKSAGHPSADMVSY